MYGSMWWNMLTDPPNGISICCVVFYVSEAPVQNMLTDPPNGISLEVGVDKILVSKYLRTRCTAVARPMVLCLVKIVH